MRYRRWLLQDEMLDIKYIGPSEITDFYIYRITTIFEVCYHPSPRGDILAIASALMMHQGRL